MSKQQLRVINPTTIKYLNTEKKRQTTQRKTNKKQHKEKSTNDLSKSFIEVQILNECMNKKVNGVSESIKVQPRPKMGDHAGIQQVVVLAAHGFSVFPFVCSIPF